MGVATYERWGTHNMVGTTFSSVVDVLKRKRTRAESLRQGLLRKEEEKDKLEWKKLSESLGITTEEEEINNTEIIRVIPSEKVISESAIEERTDNTQQKKDFKSNIHAGHLIRRINEDKWHRILNKIANRREKL